MSIPRLSFTNQNRLRGNVCRGSTYPRYVAVPDNDFYINVPLQATYMDTWNVLPLLLGDLVMSLAVKL